MQRVPFRFKQDYIKSGYEETEVSHEVAHYDTGDGVSDVLPVVQRLEAHEEDQTLEGHDRYGEEDVA